MVFRGHPSKACKRCRERRLRCDLQRPSCSSCLRARLQCHGYRVTDALRISDETQLVHMKAAAAEKPATAPKRPNRTSFKLSYLPLDLKIQARERFYTHYIADFSHSWDFLYPHFDPTSAPEHLSLSIDAASLAFLAHHTNSPSAQNLGCRKYVSALRKTNKVLSDPKTAQQNTLETSLLLDLFERITDPRNKAVKAQCTHVDGALALVKHRGLQHFTDEGGLNILTRLALNSIIVSISNGFYVPKDLIGIREHIGRFVDTSDSKWRLSGVTLEVTDLLSDIRKDRLTVEEKVQKCIDLEAQLEIIDREMPPKQWYKRIYISKEQDKGAALDGFYDLYASRKETQVWNVLRFNRIVLCDEIIGSCENLDDEVSKCARTKAAMLVQEICATVPQMTDCEGPAKHKLPEGAKICSHTHTLSHFLDIYILLLGMYAAAWSRGCPPRAKSWIIVQLERMREHFGVKEAATVAEILKTQDDKRRTSPWDVYRLIGSYAFAA